MRILLAAAVAAFALATPVLADDMAKCDEATMKMVDDAIKADTDPKMKNDVDMATKEMEMAMASMKDNKMDDCSMHIGEAKKHMMMK
jgi:hypothetical protein